MGKNIKIIIVFAFMAVLIISFDEFREKEDVILAASKVVKDTEGFAGSTGIIESASYYGNKYLEDEKKIKILKELAEQLGITDDLKQSSRREKGRETFSLSKKGTDSETVLSIVTLEEKDEFGRYSFIQYITCKIAINNSPESVCHYEEILKNYLKENELADDVTVTLISFFDNELTREEISAITDRVLKSMDAKVVVENRTKELFSVYAYYDNIEDEETINLGASKTNINIAANYNEGLKQTRIYLATPVLDIEY